MSRSKPYFRTIQTGGPKEADVARDHNIKLTNYLHYDWPDVSVPPGKEPIPYEREVKCMSTASCVKNHDFILTTVLCCEDEYKEEA